jgi:hypothetical protein
MVNLRRQNSAQFEEELQQELERVNALGALEHMRAAIAAVDQRTPT